MIGTAIKLGTVGMVVAAFYGALTGPSVDDIRPVRQQQQVLHDIPWYVANTPARLATLQWCRASSERGHMPDCQNAERAAAGAIVGRPGDMFSYLEDPAYWRNNPMARRATLETCRHPEWSSYAMEKHSCAAARAAESSAP